MKINRPSYLVNFMFIHNYDDEVIISDGGLTIADKAGFYQSMEFFDLPRIGEFMRVPESNNFWIVSAIIQDPSPVPAQTPSWATVLLCNYDLFIDDASPYLYVGLKRTLVGIIDLNPYL